MQKYNIFRSFRLLIIRPVLLLCLSISLFSSATFSQVPIVEYRFDECSFSGVNGDVIDQTGDYSGRSNGIPNPLEDSVLGKSLDLTANNTSDWISVPSGAVNGLNDFSVALWFKTSVNKSQQELFQALGSSTGDDELEIFLKNNNTVYIKVRDNSHDLTSNIITTDGNWHHLVVTRVNENVCLFIDGVKQACADGVNSGVLSISNSSAITIGQEQDSYGGSFSTSQNFVGQLDEFKIYSSRLSDTEINNLYQNELAGNNIDGSVRQIESCSTLIAEYQFEKNSWNGTPSEVIDESGNGYHGQVIANSSPSQDTPALTGNPGTCGFASQNDGSIQITGLPVDSSTPGAKTTVTFWMYWDGTNNVMPVGWNFHDVWIIEGAMGFNTWNNDVYGISTSGLANGWHHVTLEFTNGNVLSNRILIDGVEQNLSQRYGAPNNQRAYVNSELRIGGVANSQEYNFHGLLDEFRVYSGVLTAAQVADIMSERHACQKATPVAEYRFDEASWNNTNNEVIDTIDGLNGVSVGDTTTVTQGQVCRAGTFDGNDDYIEVNGIDTYLSSTASLSFWIKTSQSGNNTAWQAPGIIGVEQNGGANDIFWGFLDASGNIRIQKGNGSSASSTTAVNDDTWHHVVLTWDSVSGEVQTFVDGNLEGSANSSGSDVSTTFSSIGRIDNSYSNNNFIGQLDELLIYDSVLSTSEVRTIYTNQLNSDNYDGTPRICANPVNHYRIEHDTQGFTCEAKTVTVKACANDDCDTLYDQQTSITLSPGEWVGGETLIFTGEIVASLRVTQESTITFTQTASSPDAPLRCFNGNTETCDMRFVNDGFEFYDASGGPTLPDQLAANNFTNLNLRAVRNDAGVCKALLTGEQEITLTYDCDSPNVCLTPFAGVPITGDGSAESSGTVSLTFNSEGVASLSGLSYADAGRVKIKAQAEIDDVTITASTNGEPLDIYPSYLALSVQETALNYAGSANENNYLAGANFTLVVGAYGTNDELLPNYQSAAPQIKVSRLAPSSAGVNGIMRYADAGSKTSAVAASFENTVSLAFIGGEYRYPSAYYSEVGRIEVDLKDNSYLGNEISSNGPLTLGNFYPAYFDVSLSQQPSLANTCGVFSYLGQEIEFATDPELSIIAYNALDQITQNYSASSLGNDNFWNYLPSQAVLNSSLSYLDSSNYTTTGSASVINLGDTPLIDNNDNFTGVGKMTITNGRFKYDKVDSTNSNQTYAKVSPFSANLDLVFSSAFFNQIFTGQAGSETICYKDSYASTSCNNFTIQDVQGTQIRYGRLVLESTYGPETESLNVPIKAEFFDAGQWRVNTDDNCTSIAFTLALEQIKLTPIDGYNTDLVGDIESDGQLIMGLPIGNQLALNAPCDVNGLCFQGQLELSLDPTAIGVEWPIHLNYDWDGDGNIDTDDFPKSIISFGQFRSNDRIIQWREVFN